MNDITDAIKQIEKRCGEYFDQESGPGVSPGVQRGLDFCYDITKILVALESRATPAPEIVVKVRSELFAIAKVILNDPDGAIKDTLWYTDTETVYDALIGVAAQISDLKHPAPVAVDEAALARCRAIAQTVIEAIGSAGPEDAEQAVARLLVRFNAVKLEKQNFEKFTQRLNGIITESNDMLLSCALQFLMADDAGIITHSYMSTEEALCDMLVGRGILEQISRGKFRVIAESNPELSGPASDTGSGQAPLLGRL